MKNFGITKVRSRARAVPRFWNFEGWVGTKWHGRATSGTGRAKVLDVRGSIFFVCLNRSWTITFKTT